MLKTIGNIYFDLGEKQKALDYLNKALPLLQSLGDRHTEISVLTYLGLIYDSLDEKQRALTCYLQLLPLLRAMSKRQEEALTLTNIGFIYNSLGESSKALEYFIQSLLPSRMLRDRRGEAIALDQIGTIYLSLGEKQKALSYYLQALPIWRALGNRREEAITLVSIGFIHNSLGDQEKALGFYSPALTHFRTMGERQWEATVLNNIGKVFSSLGEQKKALDYYDQALRIRQGVRDRSGEAEMLNNIGAVHGLLGEWQKALDHFNQALLVLRSVGDRQGTATALNNIGAIYDSLGEQRKALDYLNQALLIWQAVGNHSQEATMLCNIGAIHDSLGNQQKALDFYNKALALSRASSDHQGEATALKNIGGIYLRLNSPREAIDNYTQALRLFKSVGDSIGIAGTLNDVGAVYILLPGEKQKALDCFNQALLLWRDVGDRLQEITSLENIAYLERGRGNLIEARAKIEAAIRIAESLRTEVVSREMRASYFATVQKAYEFYIDLLMQMHKQERAKGYHSAALQVSERARARSLLDSLTEARTNIRQGIDPALLAHERSVQQQLNAKAEARFKLPSTAETQIAALNREIDALTTELQQVQTQIRQASPRYAALTQPQPLNAAEIQQQVLDAETLLLEYALGAERSFVWAVTPTALTSYELPKREVIEAAARQVYELITARNKDEANETREQKQARVAAADRAYPAAATRLSQMLLAPVAQHLGKKRLVIVADGALHYLPFGALPDPTSKASGWQPLLVEHEVVNLPSASTLAVLRRELKGRAPAAKTLAVIADPVFTRADERFRAGAAPVAKVTAKAEPTLRELANAQVVRKLIPAASGDLDIRRLKYSRDEANALLALTSARAALQALDFDATRALVESDRLSQYRYVHFATHGLADSERAELSTIVLSLFDAQGRPVDGFLRAHEVYNLNLPAELVVLSACETGLGKLTKGEGLVSLTRGFMYAGAARVVVSLWAVNDRATAELMTSFYRKMLNEGQRPAAALRAAQIEMWRTPQWTAPYYWAAFTLQGEWR